MRRRTIVLLTLLVLIALLAVIVVGTRSVDVSSLLDDRAGTGIELRVFEQDEERPIAVLRVRRDDSTVAELQQVLEDGMPQWRWRGHRPDLSRDSFRVEIVTATKITRLSVSGMVHVSDARGGDGYASTPRSKLLYDRIVAIIKGAGE